MKKIIHLVSRKNSYKANLMFFFQSNNRRKSTASKFDWFAKTKEALNLIGLLVAMPCLLLHTELSVWVTLEAKGS